MMKNIASNKFFLMAVIAVVLLLFFAYANHFNNPFQFDDDHTIVSNKYIRSLKNIPQFFTDATTTSSLPANQTYRPGLTTLNAIDYWLAGNNEPQPFAFHLSIFVSFIFLGVLLYFFCLKVFDNALNNPNNKWFALLAAAVFCLHTANAETINYIIARSDSFSTLMIILSFTIYMYKPAWRNKFVFVFPVVVGYFVKEPTIMLLPLLALYIYFFEYNLSVNDLLSKTGISTAVSVLKKIWPLIIVVPLLMFLSQQLIAESFDLGLELQENYVRNYRLTQPFVAVHYIANFILPVNLTADTDWTVVASYFDERVIIGTLCCLSLVIVAIQTSVKNEYKPISFGIFWFFLALLPTSAVPLSEVLNDHRPFFPYIGLVLALVWWLAIFFYKSGHTNFKAGIIISFCFLFLAGHTYGTRQRCKVWSSGENLWKDVAEKSPKNGRGLMNYGNSLMSKGQYQDALNLYVEAQKYIPNYPYLYVNMAILRNAMGFPSEADQYFNKALQLNKMLPESYYYYGQFLISKSRFAEAGKIIRKGLEISPAHTSLQAILAVVVDAEKQNIISVDPTKSPLDNAIIIASNNPTHDNYIELSLQYYLAQDYNGCIKAAHEALKINPKSDLAYNNICSAYNMLKNWKSAIEAGKKGLELNPNNQQLKNNLNISLQEQSKM